MNVGFRINLAVASVSPPIGTSQADPKPSFAVSKSIAPVLMEFNYWMVSLSQAIIACANKNSMECYLGEAKGLGHLLRML